MSNIYFCVFIYYSEAGLKSMNKLRQCQFSPSHHFLKKFDNIHEGSINGLNSITF